MTSIHLIDLANTTRYPGNALSVPSLNIMSTGTADISADVNCFAHRMDVEFDIWPCPYSGQHPQDGYNWVLVPLPCRVRDNIHSIPITIVYHPRIVA